MSFGTYSLFWNKKKTRKIKKLRTFIQIGFVLIFFGIFIDKYNIPASEMPPHEVLIADSAFGVNCLMIYPCPFLLLSMRKDCNAHYGNFKHIFTFFNAGGRWAYIMILRFARLAIVFVQLLQAP